MLSYAAQRCLTLAESPMPAARRYHALLGERWAASAAVLISP